MKEAFNLIRATRKNVRRVISSLNEEQLNLIPPGFNNSIAWNLAHLPVTMELLTYGLAGLPKHLSNEQITAFRKGSRPEQPLTAEGIDFFKQELVEGVDRLEADYEAGVFSTIRPYPTSYGVEIGTIEAAIQFNYVHEALHLGYIMAMKRLVI